MARISFELVPYCDELLHAYKTLLPELAPLIDAGKIAWKLRDHPVGPGAGAIGRSSEGAIVGLTAFQPARFIDGDDKLFCGYQSMDVAVAPDAVAPGMLLWLMRTFYEQHDYPFVYGFPNNSAAPFHFGRQLRWKSLGTAPMLWRPLRAGFILRRLRLEGLDFPLPRFPGRRAALTRVKRFDEAQRAAWAALRRLSTPKMALDRAPDILNWRYADNPAYSYDLWTKGDEALAVSRLTDKHGARILYICELIGSVDDMADMVETILDHYADQQPEVAFAWAIEGSPVCAAFSQAGFFKLPDRLRPITINFGARGSGRDPGCVPDRCEWMLSYLDSDTV
ncbi:MAG: hypothetical protein WAK01_02860 [Methylocystis sp.]